MFRSHQMEHHLLTMCMRRHTYNEYGFRIFVTSAIFPLLLLLNNHRLWVAGQIFREIGSLRKKICDFVLFY